MNRFMLLQSLESRTLFSATLLADQAAIVADGAAMQAAVQNLAAQNKAALAAITVDLKTLPKTNASLQKKIALDQSKLVSATNSDQTAITKSSGTLAKKAVIAGNTLLQAWTLKAESAVAADSTALNTILVAPLGKLHLDLMGPLVTDLGTLLANNPGATQLATDLAAEQAAYAAAATALTSAAAKYQTSIGKLASDLAAIPKIPNILFTYSGTKTEKTGSHPGRTKSFTLTVTVEAADGSWTGTVATVNGSGVPETQAANGSVTSTGAFSGLFASGTILTATVSGNTIKGTYKSPGSGTFSMSH